MKRLSGIHRLSFLSAPPRALWCGDREFPSRAQLTGAEVGHVSDDGHRSRYTIDLLIIHCVFWLLFSSSLFFALRHV